MQQRNFFITGKAVLGFLLMAAIFGFGVYLVFRSLQQLSGEVAIINEPNRKLAQWKALRAKVNEAADMVRRYALSGNEEELDRFEDLRIDLPLHIDSLRQQLPDSLRHYTDTLEVLAGERLQILSLLSSAPEAEAEGSVLDEAVTELNRIQQDSRLMAETTVTRINIKPQLNTWQKKDSAAAQTKPAKKRRRNESVALPETTDSVEAPVTQSITKITYTPQAQRDAEIYSSLNRLRWREKFAEKIRNEGRLELLLQNQEVEQRMADLSENFEAHELRQSALLIQSATAFAEKRAQRIAQALAVAGFILILFFTLLIHRDSRRSIRLRMQTERARDNAEELAQAREQFVANMSHEVRTPLNVISGFTGALMRSPLNSEQLKQVQSVNRASQYLIALINDTLDYSKMNAGKLELDNFPFSTAELFSDIQSAFEGEAQNRGIGLRCVADSSVPAFLTGDPMRLRQILFNLVANAIKFTATGEVSITAKATPVNDTAVDVVIEVADTGIGIPPEKLNSIFEAFSQADSSITRRFGGTGLGLTISRLLTERMNGTLSVSSEQGKGSVFTVSIPGMALAKDQIAQTEAPKEYSTLNGLKVLVCDDEELNRIVAQQLLEHYGIEVSEAANGNEAIDALGQHEIHIVLMDVQMPGQSGIDTVQQIRQTPGIENSIVVAVTGNALPEEKQRCMDAGMNAYLAKPYTEEQLLDLLVQLDPRKTP
ncbi:MAG: ATP-binding protein [Bacteroidia bacterium]|jgi:signal transduction histidine kinase/ActR/RegA family two-component response regulator|nr:ATP-binding protein [Bacteroidia bacterium]